MPLILNSLFKCSIVRYSFSNDKMKKNQLCISLLILLFTVSCRKDFEEILPLIERARKDGAWLILAGHEMGDSGGDNTRSSMLKKLIEYAQDPVNGTWIAPMGTVAKYVRDTRKQIKKIKL